MDTAAVWQSQESDLKALGLVQRGHLICLKGFCMNSLEPTEKKGSDVYEMQDKLSESIKCAGKDRLSSNKRRRRADSHKLVYMGWKHLDKSSSSYKAVRAARGGGTREMLINENTDYSELLKIMKKLFFPNGKSIFGFAVCMDFQIGNFQGSEISSHNFTISNYCKEFALSKVRVYLLTRKKRITEYSLTRSDSDSDFECENLPVLSALSTANVTTHQPAASSPTSFSTQSSVTLATSTPEHVEKADLPKESSQLIGSSQERESLISEIERAFNESLAEDQSKSSREVQNHIQLSTELSRGDKSSLRERRLSRVPSEPELSEEHIVMSVQHPTLGIRRRIFRSDAPMSSVYDWVGSLAEEPPYFELCSHTTNNSMNYLNEPISSDKKAQEYANITLKVKEIDHDENIDESDLSSSTIDQLYCELQLLREEELRKLNQIPLKIVVDRENIFEDLINLYKKRSTVLHVIELAFKEENAAGDGITKDAFSCFFQALYTNMDGYNEKVPNAKLDDSTLVIVGKICTHAFLNCNIFPLQFCKTSLKNALFGEVKDGEILSSFLEFIHPKEKEMVENFSSSHPLQPIQDILLEYSVTERPTKENIRKLMCIAGRNALIRSPYVALQKVSEGMGIFWKKVTSEGLDSLYASTIPTAEKVIEAIVPEEICAKDARITTWLHRYLRSSSKDELTSFLRFVTGAGTLPPDAAIKLQYIDQSSPNLRPVSQTCFKILTLARQYGSFTELTNNLNFYFGAKDLWAVHDVGF